VTTRVLPSTGTKKTPPPGPRRPKDPRRKGFADDYDLQIHGADHLVAKLIPVRSQQQVYECLLFVLTETTERQKITRSRWGRPRGSWQQRERGGAGVGVAETVDVSIKKNLVRAHAVVLKDGGENVVFRVEAIGTPEGIDKKGRVRKSATRAANSARGVRARGRTRARRTRRLATCVTATRASVVAGIGERESTWGVRTREPDDLVLHLVEREGVTVVDVGEKLFVRLLVAGGFREVEAHESDEGVDVLDIGCTWLS
jgi:hypothetical protein